MMLYLGKYKALSKIGEGGMASVYLVEDEKFGKMAVKVLSRKYLEEDVPRKRFRNESSAVQKLDHPNIVKIYQPASKIKILNGRGSFETLAYAMEYFPSRSLKELITNRKMPGELILDFLNRLLDALEYCHKKRVYHRDLKPANILIKNDGASHQPILTDFGIAKFSNAELTKFQDLTKDVSVLGAPAYMSPEQIRNPRNVDARSDLYSLGIVLYEMSTGKRPFVGTRSELLDQQLVYNPPSPSKINPAIDRKLDRLIVRLLQKEPRNRPQNTEEIRTIISGTSKVTVQKDDNRFEVIVYYKNNVIGKKILKTLPIHIGAKPGTGSSNIEIKNFSGRVENIHCEILKDKSGQIVIRNNSKTGTIINQKKIFTDYSALLNGRNEIKLPGYFRLELIMKPDNQSNPKMLLIFFFIFLFIIFILLLIII